MTDCAPQQSFETGIENLSLAETDRCLHQSTESSDESVGGYVMTDTDCEDQMQRSIIREALDQQTQILYEQYAREQHPKDPQKQKELVLDMQEQYFARYMMEHHQQLLLHQQQQLEQWSSFDVQQTGSSEKAESNGKPAPLPLIPATIWISSEIAEFKQQILKTQRECCIKIGSLATATIRVPTHKDGTSIFWEFATDRYDLGFGLFFEWDLEPPDTITVNVSESSDEGEYQDDDPDLSGRDVAHSEQTDSTRGDVESGCRPSSSRVPTDELIPIYRRDCHTDVYCGSHHYPGTGVYVFKFDNSFSLWRSKWLYYRIYYTQ